MNSTPMGRTNNVTNPMLFDTALDLVNISSSSEEGFTVEPFSLPELEERFRVAPPSSTNMPTAFLGSTEASLFVTNSVDVRSTECVDTRGTSIETELMDLLSDIQDISPTTFIDTSDEDMNPFPEANFANRPRNSYGRPIQRVCPVPRQQHNTTSNANQPVIPSETSAFTAYTAPQQRAIDPNPRPMQQAPYLPMPVPFYPNSWNNVGHGPYIQIPQPPPNNVPTNNGTVLQMNPPVMPEVAGYCPGCSKTYDQIAVETLTSYVAWSEYPEETIRDRKVRSRAFVDGFGAALICFKNAGLSPAYPCEMSGVQHR